MRFDRRYLRAIREHRDDNGVLNGDWRSPPSSPHPPALIAVELLEGLLTGDIERAAEARRSLAGADPRALEPDARVAFWLNVYNALVIDAFRAFDVCGSVLDVRGFFHRAAYTVCNHRFSLADIEHGILRGNRAPHPRLPVQFAAGDQRAAFIIQPCDPRLHFALNCGARSCPPVRVYHAETLDEDLDLVSRAFLSAEIMVVEDHAVVPGILYQYADDFGGLDRIASWLLEYVDDVEVRELIAAGRMAPAEFDWALLSVVPVR